MEYIYHTHIAIIIHQHLHAVPPICLFTFLSFFVVVEEIWITFYDKGAKAFCFCRYEWTFTFVSLTQWINMRLVQWNGKNVKSSGNFICIDSNMNYLAISGGKMDDCKIAAAICFHIMYIYHFINMILYVSFGIGTEHTYEYLRQSIYLTITYNVYVQISLTLQKL